MKPASVRAPKPVRRRRWLDTGAIARANSYQMIAVEGVVNAGPVQIVSEYQNLFRGSATTASDPTCTFTEGMFTLRIF